MSRIDAHLSWTIGLGAGRAGPVLARPLFSDFLFQPDHSKSPSYASDAYQCMRLDVAFHKNARIWYYIAHRTQKNNPSVALQIISEISAQIYL